MSGGAIVRRSGTKALQLQCVQQLLPVPGVGIGLGIPFSELFPCDIVLEEAFEGIQKFFLRSNPIHSTAFNSFFPRHGSGPRRRREFAILAAVPAC